MLCNDVARISFTLDILVAGALMEGTYPMLVSATFCESKVRILMLVCQQHFDLQDSAFYTVSIICLSSKHLFYFYVVNFNDFLSVW